MEAFASGETDVLVATTVIEVGIDVANATVMVIEGAERYGVSQLHQLRGRVGRGEHGSHCLLFAEEAGELARRAAARRSRASATASSWPRSTSRCAARARCSAPASTGCRASPSPSLPEDAPTLVAAREEVLALLRAPRLARRPRPSARCSTPPAAASASAPPTRSALTGPATIDRCESGRCDEGHRRRAEGAAPGRPARLEGAADLRPRPRGDLLGAGRRSPVPASSTSTAAPAPWRSRRSRAVPPPPSWSTATRVRRSATSSGSGSRDRTELVRADVGRWLGALRGAPTPQASTSSSSTPPIDSPTAWGSDSNTHLPGLLAETGGRSSRAAPAGRCGSTRWSGCASAATAPPTCRSTAGGGDERAQRHRRLPGQLRPGHQRPPRHHHPHLHVFERVVVGVVNNPIRKEKTLFTAEERQASSRRRRPISPTSR